MSGTAPLLVWNGIVVRIATAVEAKPVGPAEDPQVAGPDELGADLTNRGVARPAAQSSPSVTASPAASSSGYSASYSCCSSSSSSAQASLKRVE